MHHAPQPSPRSSVELAASIRAADTVTVRERELSGMFNPRHIEDILADLAYREATLSKEDGISIADIRVRGILRDFGVHARAINDMLRAPQAIEFMQAILGERRYAEGAQVHRMPMGSSLPAHRHGDDDVFAIFHFGRTYQGGAYFEERNGVINYPDIPPYSLFISRGVVVHGVEPVTAGQRVVLVT
ncbi:MAG: hypothetical protein RL417_1441, partial [Pseudomonadota bacterium]